MTLTSEPPWGALEEAAAVVRLQDGIIVSAGNIVVSPLSPLRFFRLF